MILKIIKDLLNIFFISTILIKILIDNIILKKICFY